MSFVLVSRIVLAAGLAGLVLALPIAPAQAKCAARSLDISPARGARQLPRNLQIVVEAYGHQRDKLVELLDGAALRGGGKRVPLALRRLRQQNKASFRTSHFVLSPKAPLAAATRYRLVLAKGQKPPAALAYWVKKLRAYEIATGRGSDRVKPKKPTLRSEGYSYTRFGCGPASRIALKLDGLSDDRSPSERLGVLLHVVERSSQGKRAFALRLRGHHGGRTSLGHGMCSGNFGQLRRGARYTIRASVIDRAGNVSEPSDAVSVRVKR